VGLKQSILFLSSLGIVISRVAQGDIHIALISKTLNLSSEIKDGQGPVFPRLSFPCSNPMPTLEEVRAAVEAVDDSLSDWKLARWEKYLQGFDLPLCVMDALSDAAISVKERLDKQDTFLNDGDVKSMMEGYDGDKIYPFFRVILADKKEEDQSEMEILSIGDNFEILSSNK
jgi:hypothetical protein